MNKKLTYIGDESFKKIKPSAWSGIRNKTMRTNTFAVSLFLRYYFHKLYEFFI